MVFYLETSAAVKLIVHEAETEAMLAFALDQDGNLFSSDLTRTDLLRVVRRHAADRGVEARRLLDRTHVVDLPSSVFERAAMLDPAILRTLDALHLAAALELGADLEGIVTYDDRLASSARVHGIAVVSPGVADTVDPPEERSP
ncbi:MAG: PIN domain-containing protein [Acidimicrobiaceae bacterium]|nr:PIN domain-containing protein [Acidimicrobiaceae bacterium]MCY4176148.1 PIN domain-containing protein [Acidimicrobiaceae bacterium]MCY4280401.1 PIN domain-containing protein [Acidimicrobiaceae bacterium]MCY4294351.1 PIN domain-containing protein [Acidimicrobiaceae bacterium]